MRAVVLNNLDLRYALLNPKFRKLDTTTYASNLFNIQPNQSTFKPAKCKKYFLVGWVLTMVGIAPFSFLAKHKNFVLIGLVLPMVGTTPFPFLAPD